MRVQLSLAARLTLLSGFAAILTLGSAPAAPAAPAATGLAAMQGNIAGQLRLAGPADGAYVYDITEHRVLFSERATSHAPPGLGREALHGHGCARAAGPGIPPQHDRLRGRPPGPRGRLGRQPVPVRGRGPHLRLQLLHRRPLRRRRELGLDPGPRPEGGRDQARQRPGDRRRIDVRQPAGGAVQRLRLGPVPRRLAQRPGLQPRGNRQRSGSPRPGRLRRPPAARRPAGRRGPRERLRRSRHGAAGGRGPAGARSPPPRSPS